MYSKAEEQLKQVEREQASLRATMTTIATEDAGLVCEICRKTKFADPGAGHTCHYCGLRTCNRCGARLIRAANKVRVLFQTVVIFL